MFTKLTAVKDFSSQTYQADLRFTQFSTRYDPETSAIWCWLHPGPRPCVNMQLLEELDQLQLQLTHTYNSQNSDSTWPFRHLILASKVPGVYNYGGDLELFRDCILNKDRESLREYAYRSTSLVYHNITNLKLPITMLALVQGEALGGGFETALSCDVIIAERSAKMGFPEILFNLFPGMGAYHLLTRRIGASLAERMILSGNTYSAVDLYEMGIVDVLAEDGEGQIAVEKYLKSHNQSHSTIRSMKQIRQIVHPISRDSLFDVVDIWVDAAMKLEGKDLTKLERLLHMQKDMRLRSPDQGESPRIKRKGDWRKVCASQFPLRTHLGETVGSERRTSRRRQE